jgi:hypothetical protein
MVGETPIHIIIVHLRHKLVFILIIINSTNITAILIQQFKPILLNILLLIS